MAASGKAQTACFNT